MAPEITFAGMFPDASAAPIFPHNQLNANGWNNLVRQVAGTEPNIPLDQIYSRWKRGLSSRGGTAFLWQGADAKWLVTALHTVQTGEGTHGFAPHVDSAFLIRRQPGGDVGIGLQDGRRLLMARHENEIVDLIMIEVGQVECDSDWTPLSTAILGTEPLANAVSKSQCWVRRGAARLAVTNGHPAAICGFPAVNSWASTAVSIAVRYYSDLLTDDGWTLGFLGDIDGGMSGGPLFDVQDGLLKLHGMVVSDGHSCDGAGAMGLKGGRAVRGDIICRVGAETGKWQGIRVVELD